MQLIEFVDPVLRFARGAFVYFNVLLSVYLALTAVLNARERNGPIIFAGLALLGSAGFFAMYALSLAIPLRFVLARVGGPAGVLALLVLVGLPFAWYLVVLQYAGFRENIPEDPRQRRWVYARLIVTGALCLLSLLCAVAAALVLYRARSTNSIFYMYRVVEGVELRVFLAVFGMHVIASTGFAFGHIFSSPFREEGVRGTARRKARRAMVRAGGMMFVLAWLVAGVVVLFFVASIGKNVPRPYFWSVILRIDAVAAGLITFVTYYVGRAIISYEIFSGTVLPERALQRQWKNAVSFAGVYALFGGMLFFVSRGAVLAGLAGGVLSAFFLIRLGWRLRTDRALHARALRPFLGSQDLYGTVLRLGESDAPAEHDEEPARESFAGFCLEILEARGAALVPGGSSAALLPRPLVFVDGSMPAVGPEELEDACLALARDINDRAAFRSEAGPARNFLPLQPTEHAGYIAAIPLWSGESSAGLLLLGEKRGGGVYTLEEIEIAQAAGERLIDLLAATRLARVLRELERARLIEQGLTDNRARRVLHDDILPEIHMLMLRSGSAPETQAVLADLHGRIAALLHEMPATRPDFEEGLVQALRRFSAETLGLDRLVLDIDDRIEKRASELSSIQTEVLFFAVREAIRNASRHARRQDRELEVIVHIRKKADRLELTVTDNGGPPQATDPGGEPRKGGAGRGLALHGAMLAVIGGGLEFTREAAGARVRLFL